MSKKFYACLYGGASERIDDIYKKEVERLGEIIVNKGFSLVYGAGATGSMGAIATGVRNAGGYIMGITPHFMKSFEEIFKCDNTIMVDTMGERKTLMEKHADVFLIAPGGIGTMDEFFQVLTLKYLKQLDVPIVILNLNGFYDSLLALIDSLVSLNAVSEVIYKLFSVVDSVDDRLLLEILEDIKNT